MTEQQELRALDSSMMLSGCGDASRGLKADGCSEPSLHLTYTQPCAPISGRATVFLI